MLLTLRKASWRTAPGVPSAGTSRPGSTRRFAGAGATKCPKEPVIRRRRIQPPRLLAIVDPAAGPVASNLAVVDPVSRDRPRDCSPSRFDSECRPLQARFRIGVRMWSGKGTYPPFDGRAADLSTFEAARSGRRRDPKPVRCHIRHSQAPQPSFSPGHSAVATPGPPPARR